LLMEEKKDIEKQSNYYKEVQNELKLKINELETCINEKTEKITELSKLGIECKISEEDELKKQIEEYNKKIQGIENEKNALITKCTNMENKLKVEKERFDVMNEEINKLKQEKQ